jgi:hypothetical protein
MKKYKFLLVAMLAASQFAIAGKVSNMLEYVIIKYIPHNGPAVCKEKKIDGKNFVLCTWDRAKALFIADSPSRIYAVNGQARRTAFTRYDEISSYKNHDINIPAVIDKIEKQ